MTIKINDKNQNMYEMMKGNNATMQIY